MDHHQLTAAMLTNFALIGVLLTVRCAYVNLHEYDLLLLLNFLG